MARYSRRMMLRTTAMGGAAIGLQGRSSMLSMALASAKNQNDPDIKFPVSARDRLAVASYPFRGYIDSPDNRDRDAKLPEMDLRTFATQVKQKFGVPGVEPLSEHFPSTDAAYLHTFREAIEKAGVQVVNIPAGSPSSFYDAGAAARRKAVESGKHWVGVAVTVGSPSIRISMGKAKNAKPKVEVAAQELRQLAEYAAAKNVVVNLENDDLTSEDAFFIVNVIETANHPYLRALPDFCNSMTTGNEKFNYEAVARMFQHAYCICHVKDSEPGEDGKMFSVDLKKSFHILKASNFRGYCSMEWEGGGDPYAGTQKLIAASLQYLS
jgi:sugar phosphate isomerase/epimerase